MPSYSLFSDGDVTRFTRENLKKTGADNLVKFLLFIMVSVSSDFRSISFFNDILIFVGYLMLYIHPCRIPVVILFNP